MNNLLKKGAIAATAIAVIGLATATPSEARCHGCGAAAAGFVAGAAVGAVAANSYYGPRYGYGYYGGPGYAYYGGPYAYEPAPIYSEPVYAAQPVYRTGSCWHVTDDTRGYGYYGSCATPTVRAGSRTTSTSGH